MAEFVVKKQIQAHVPRERVEALRERAEKLKAELYELLVGDAKPDEKGMLWVPYDSESCSYMSLAASDIGHAADRLSQALEWWDK